MLNQDSGLNEASKLDHRDSGHTWRVSSVFMGGWKGRREIKSEIERLKKREEDKGKRKIRNLACELNFCEIRDP